MWLQRLRVDAMKSGVYSYKIKQSDGTTSGFDAAGNITAYYDSTSGQWNNIQYDALNRLVRADGPSAFNGSSPYFCWTYDSFGNRTGQNSEPTGPFTVVSTVGSQSCTAYSGVTATTDVESYSSGDASNQLRSSSHLFGIERSGSASYDYDAAGELTDDGAGGHQYAYDAEGRLCAEYNGTAYIGYLYNASGIRVAKGTQSSLSCDLTGNGFTMTSMYVIDQGGQTMTETDGSGVWQHTDVDSATYDSNGLHFQMADWLGTRRVQTDYAGTVETSFQHLPFGELLTSLSGDATEKHFTGKEHDTESGNDYFDARYYASSAGRFMIPDWSAKVEPVPYAKLADPQTLNLYSYGLNNALSGLDADGHATDMLSNIAHNFADLIADHELQRERQEADQNNTQVTAGQHDANAQAHQPHPYVAPTGPGTEIGNILDPAHPSNPGPITSPSDPNGQCVTSCRHFSGLPDHTQWTKGDPVVISVNGVLTINPAL